MPAGLNEAQHAAVTHPPGPLLVLAGAGSGKTRVLTRRIAHLIDRHSIAPDRVLAVTFTNKAAREMQERVGQLLRLGADAPRPWILTFHALGLRLIRAERKALGLPSGFAIYDQADSRSLARRVLSDSSVPVPTGTTPELLSAAISRFKSERLTAEAATRKAPSFRLRKMAALYLEYERALKAAGAVEFEDLLFSPLRLFETRPEALERARSRFDAVLVDEYQDTNESQYLLVRSLASEHRNITVVGDDDQSIYGWRGADVRNLKRFLKDFDEAKRVALEVNYRSTGVILDAANSVTAALPGRLEKTLRPAGERGEKIRVFAADEREAEATRVAREVRQRVDEGGARYRDFGILYRTNKQARPLEEALMKARVPFRVVGGQRFFEKKEVKDLIAFMRVLGNPADEISLRRVWNTPPRGLGAKAQETLLAEAHATGRPLGEVLGRAGELGLSARAAAGAADLARMLHAARGRLRGGKPFPEVAREVLKELRYDRELERMYKTADTTERKREALDAMLEGMDNFLTKPKNRGAGLVDWLRDMALLDELDRTKDEDPDRDELVMQTIHASKGLEYPHVYVVGLEEGNFPSARSLDERGDESLREETRLFYVAVTRAQRTLTLSWCENVGSDRLAPKDRERRPSRFLEDLPPELLETSERESSEEVRAERTKSNFAALRAMLKKG